MDNKIFKSKWTLRFNDEQIENNFYKIKQNEIIKNNPAFTFITICISLISIGIYISRFSQFDQFILFKMSKFSALVILFIHIISFIFSLAFKEKTKIQIMINLYIFSSSLSKFHSSGSSQFLSMEIMIIT